MHASLVGRVLVDMELELLTLKSVNTTKWSDTLKNY